MAPHFDDPLAVHSQPDKTRRTKSFLISLHKNEQSPTTEPVTPQPTKHIGLISELRRKSEPHSTVAELRNPASDSDSALPAFSSDTFPLPRQQERQQRRDSRVSIGTTGISIASNRSHQECLETLVPPTPEEAARISRVQVHKEEEIIKKRLSMESPQLTEDERKKAAELIQKNYRGYRTRRQMNGMAMDPTSRWIEAVREAKYRNLTQPRARAESAAGVGATHQSSPARQNWKKIGTIAMRAAGDEDSDDPSDDDEDLDEAQREEKRRKRLEAKHERQRAAKIMDLQYWLESTDLKHRYGSNLRTYHEQWLKSDTNENFFYWLDYGEGKDLDCAGCSRERLDRECVRYLSKEERQNYLVKIDKEGRLCWAKTGTRIDTTIHFKDSIHGIVPEDDPTPSYTRPEAEAATGLQDHSTSSSSSMSSEESTDPTQPHHHNHEHTSDRAGKYATPGFDKAKGVKKATHVSAATIFNKLLRSSVQKNTWIYVADTSFRLYVGIKQSGAFQHSSFLHGSRISSAGLIKIKDGRLDKLSPLSGHYRPPTKSFRAFVHSLKEAGVDMSHVSISRSYAVLVGLEAYVKTRRRGKRLVRKLIHGRDKLLEPEEVKRKEEEARDKSESAEMERRFLELQKEGEEEHRVNVRLMQKLHLSKSASGSGSKKGSMEGKPHEAEVQVPGSGAESGIPPEGKRNVEGV